VIRLAAVLAAAVLAAGPQHGAGTILEDSYRSAALGGVLPFAVYLPPGYSEQTTRYPVIEQLDAELRAAGVPHLFGVYPGAHEQTFWNAHAMQWLALALAHLAPAH
jgi:hypothetical protein